MRLAVLSLLCLFAACFQEPPADRMWRCTVDKPQCPEGQSCVNDWCVKDGTAMPDFATSDGSLTGDMSIAPCADGFPIGTKGAWACRGKFSAATVKASAICQSGYKPCADSSRVSDSECSNSSLTGFFFADALGSGLTASAKCATTTGAGWGSVIFGCGPPTVGLYERSAIGCRGFFLLGFCGSASTQCNASDGRLDAQSNTEAKNGVLCCPP